MASLQIKTAYGMQCAATAAKAHGRAGKCYQHTSWRHTRSAIDNHIPSEPQHITYKVVVCSNNQALALLAAMSEAMAVNARATLLEQVHSKRRPGQNKCNEPDAHNKGSAALASMMGHWYFILALQFCPCGVVHTHLYFST
jgi:hypothetical protein